MSPNKDIITEDDGVRALPEGIVPLNWQGQLDLYHDHELCLNLQLVSEEGNKRCMNPEGFASFFGLIRSIPFDIHQSKFTKGSIDDGPNLRYFLKEDLIVDHLEKFGWQFIRIALTTKKDPVYGCMKDKLGRNKFLNQEYEQLV